MIAQFIDDTGITPRYRNGPFDQEDVAEICGITAEEVHKIAIACGCFGLLPYDFLTGKQCIRIIQEACGPG